MAKPVPEGLHTITPHLVIKGAAAAIEFYKKAFGAREIMRMPMPGGIIGHAHLVIGDSHLFVTDEFPPEMGGTCRGPASLGATTVGLHLYLPDADAAFAKATAAGCKVLMPMMDMFWGDRFGKVQDPYGHEWSLATHKEDLTAEEMTKRGLEAMAKMGKGNC